MKNWSLLNQPKYFKRKKYLHYVNYTQKGFHNKSLNR